MSGYSFFDLLKDIVDDTKNFIDETRDQAKKDVRDIRNEAVKDLSKVPIIGEVLASSVNGLGKGIDAISNHIDANSKPLSGSSASFCEGNHLYVIRVGYSHHGIYYGSGNVIHYADSKVKIDSLEEFSKGADIYIKKYVADFSPTEITSRAASKLYESEYNLIFNNCEHFCYWCRSKNDPR